MLGGPESARLCFTSQVHSSCSPCSLPASLLWYPVKDCMFPVVAAGATLGTSTAREALEQLYASAHGAKWRASTRWLSGNVCRWHGIECDRSSHTTVVGIDLGDNRVSGTLPRHLAQLSEIKTLNIDASRLSGTLPAVLLSLAQMETLLLASNAALSGTVPHSLDAWASLRELDVAGTRLSGTLSPEVGALGHLQRLQLDHVFLSGTLPTELGWLGSARSMFTHSCKHLSGTLPTELGRASALQHISFAATRLSGTIPSQIGELHQLRALWLVGTRLSGTLPRSIGGWHALRQLEIHGNRLSGTLPTGMSGLRLSRCVLTTLKGSMQVLTTAPFPFPTGASSRTLKGHSSHSTACVLSIVHRTTPTSSPVRCRRCCQRRAGRFLSATGWAAIEPEGSPRWPCRGAGEVEDAAATSGAGGLLGLGLGSRRDHKVENTIRMIRMTR